MSVTRPSNFTGSRVSLSGLFPRRGNLSEDLLFKNELSRFSKDQVVGEAVKRGCEQFLADMESSAAGKTPEAALSTMVTKYLSANHRDCVGEACPLSSLGTDLRRADKHTRDSASDGLKAAIALVAKQITDVPPDEAKKRAHAIMAAMVGGVVLSRLANNAHLSEMILRETRKLILKQ